MAYYARASTDHAADNSWYGFHPIEMKLSTLFKIKSVTYIKGRYLQEIHRSNDVTNIIKDVK